MLVHMVRLYHINIYLICDKFAFPGVVLFDHRRLCFDRMSSDVLVCAFTATVMMMWSMNRRWNVIIIIVVALLWQTQQIIGVATASDTINQPSSSSIGGVLEYYMTEDGRPTLPCGDTTEGSCSHIGLIFAQLMSPTFNWRNTNNNDSNPSVIINVSPGWYRADSRVSTLATTSPLTLTIRGRSTESSFPVIDMTPLTLMNRSISWQFNGPLTLTLQNLNFSGGRNSDGAIVMKPLTSLANGMSHLMIDGCIFTHHSQTSWHKSRIGIVLNLHQLTTLKISNTIVHNNFIVEHGLARFGAGIIRALMSSSPDTSVTLVNTSIVNNLIDRSGNWAVHFNGARYV
jgi:hypothetical protein